MKIKSQLIVSVMSFCVITLVIGFTLQQAFLRLRELDARETTTEKLLLESHELSDLSNDYILFHEKRQKVQWETKYNSLATLLSQLHVVRPQEQMLVNSFSANQKRLKTIFDQIDLTLGQGTSLVKGGRDIEFLQVSWSRLSVQIQAMIFDASRLARLTEKERGAIQYRAASMIVGMIGVLIVFILANYIFINRRVLGSITKLHEGTTIIGAGNLDYRIEETTGDEIGSLARAFNHMSVNLKEVLASKEELNREVDQRKRAEQQLATERERLAVTLRSIGDGVISTDTEGKVLSVNQMAETLTGWPEHEAVGRQLEEVFFIINEETRQPCENPVEKVLKHGQIVELANHTMLIGRDGTERVLADSGAPIQDQHGEILGVVLVFRDVTERARAAEELRAREETLRAILAASPVGIVLTQDRCIKWANDSWVQMFEFANKDEYLDQPTSIMHKSQEDYEHLRQVLYDHLKPAGVSEADASMKRKDGTLFDSHIRIRLLDSSDPSKGTISAITDISERKNAQEGLRRTSQEFQALIQASPVAIVAFDKNSIVKLWNPAAEQIFGWTAAEATGKYLPFVPEDKIGEHIEIRERAIQGARLTGIEAQRQRKDGSRIAVSGSPAPLLDSKGNITGIMAVFVDITERKKAEDELRQSQEKYRNIFDNAIEGIFQSSPEGRLITVNSAYARMFGYGSPEEMVREVTDIASQLYANPADREKVKRRFGDLVPPTNYEIECRRKDGTHFWVAMDARSVGDENGGILYYEGMVEDITARKQTEEALRKSEALLKEAQRVAHIGHWEIDSPTGTPRWSEEIFHIFGLDPAQGEPSFPAHQNLIHPDDWDLLNSSMIRGTSQSIPFDIDFRLIHFDRSIRWMNAKGRPTGRREGEFFGMFGTAQDITERKLAQEGLRKSEQRYRMLFNDSKDGVYVTSRDGQLLDANQAYFDLLGYEKEEIVGRHILTTYVNPIDRDRFVQAIESSGFLKDYPLSLLRKDGKQMDCLITASLRRTEDDAILGYHGIIRDVTEQKNLQNQLLQAQKMEAIGTLAGGIAHDFNNLLQVMLGYSELLLAEKDQNHPEYTDLQKIFHAAKNGADLVQRLLMFSRKTEPKPIPMNLNRQVLHVEKLLRRTIPRMIDIQLELAADLPEINADQSQIEQVLMNLAVNARDAMFDAGKLTVKTGTVTLDQKYCRLHVEANPGEYVVLEISDSGHGVDKETIEHIFEPFFTTKEMGKGTGLGLAMVYGIVKQHNGHITVYSEVGKGTTFKVYLPAIPSHVEPAVEDRGIMPALGTETVLLVDDEEFVRELGARILTKHGYTVLQAERGAEALDLFRTERSKISLVILDLIMPDMGGTECLKELLKIDPHVRVLAASGFSGDTAVKEIIGMGAKGFVSKPFRFKELLRDVRKVLDEADAPRE